MGMEGRGEGERKQRMRGRKRTCTHRNNKKIGAYGRKVNVPSLTTSYSNEDCRRQSMGVSNLPRVVTQPRPGRQSNSPEVIIITIIIVIERKNLFHRCKMLTRRFGKVQQL